MFRCQWLICCFNLARSLAPVATPVEDLRRLSTIDPISEAWSKLFGRVLEEPDSTGVAEHAPLANPLAALTVLNTIPDAANTVVPLNTPLGELMVPFSSLFSKGLRMLFDMFKEQQLPISQADLTVLTSSLSDLAQPATMRADDREPPPVHRTELAPIAPERGITFREPEELTKQLADAELPVVLIGVDEDQSRLIRSQDYEVQHIGGSKADAVAKAIATVGLARVWAEMEDIDFMDSLSLMDTSGIHESMKYSNVARENDLTPNEVKEFLIKDLLATTTDTLPWLPLDGIVKSLPKFLVDRMGKTGELLGTLASYWKTGAETIDNVAGGLLKPVLNNIQSNNEEDYTGRNGFVENVNVPDEEVSFERKIVTGAGIPPQTSPSRADSYLQYPYDGTGSQGRDDYSLYAGRKRRLLWAVDGLGAETSSDLFDNVQKNADVSDPWMWSDLEADWAAPPFVAELNNPHLMSEQAIGFSRSGLDLDSFNYKQSYERAAPQPEWELREEPAPPFTPKEQKRTRSPEGSDSSRKGSLNDKKHLLDRLHEQVLKKNLHRNRGDEHSRINTVEDGPVSLLREIVKNRQDLLRSNKEGPSALERFRAERLGREKLIVGDDFDEEDELFDDDDDDDTAVASPSPKHERNRRRDNIKNAPPRELSEWDEEAPPYLEYAGFDNRGFNDVNPAGNLIGNVISSFIGGGEPDMLTPALGIVKAAAAASNPLASLGNNNAAVYDNLKLAVQKQKEQLDSYLEQMASMYQVPGPNAEASVAAAAQQAAREQDRMQLMEDVAKKVSEELAVTMRDAEAQRAEDNNMLWDELDRERHVLEQILSSNATIEPGILSDLAREDHNPPPASAVRTSLRNRAPPAAGSNALQENQEFFPVNNMTSGIKLATIKDVIDQMISSITKFSPPRNLLAYSKVAIVEDDTEFLRDVGAAPYEASEVIPTKTDIDPSDDSKELNDWYDFSDDWAGMRSDLVSQIASSVNDVSKTVHNNPLADIVQSLIEGIVDANPLKSDERSNYDSRKGYESRSYYEEEQTEPSNGGVQERLAQSAASMLRQISNKVIKSGPRIKSSAADLELKQPDPDPVKKAGAPSNWWF